jgi:hypothetical protein
MQLGEAVDVRLKIASVLPGMRNSQYRIHGVKVAADVERRN